MAFTAVPRFDTELRNSPKPVIALLVVVGIIAGCLAPGSGAGEEPSKEALVFALATWAVAAVLWMVEDWRPLVGRWLMIGAISVLVGYSRQWFGEAGVTAFAFLPVALAAALIGPAAALLTSLLGTLALLLLRRYAPASLGLTEMGMGLVAMWTMCGLMYGISHPVRKLAGWSWEQFSHAQALLEEARDRQAELRQALEDLAYANRQLALTNERLAATRLIAEEAQKIKAEFVARVSHEFRTPLNMILGLIDLLMEAPEVYGPELPPALFHDLEIVHRNCEHLASMINDVLDLSQIEAGRLALHREQCSLTEVITRALAVVSPLLDKKGLSLTVDIADDLPTIYCDRTRIRQVILNLVSNAARLTDVGGITVQARGDGDFVTVSVHDTGPGVATEDQERIFEPFYQGTTKTKRPRSGTGLGLSISKQFVDMHEGKMWLESQVGVGSTFSFRLPILPPMGHVATPARWIAASWVDHSPRRKVPPAPRLDQRVILCDEAGGLHALLQRYADDVEFVSTRSLEEATQELERAAAQAILVNTAAPQSLQALVERASREIPDIPILGCALPPRTEQANPAGATGYLLKPVLLSHLADVLDGIGTPVKSILLVDDDPDALGLLMRMLRVYRPDLQMMTASSGHQALSTLREARPDAMLLDIILPDIDGRQVLALKAQDEEIRDIPVVLVSAQDPHDQPLESKLLIATMGKGLSLSKLLRCSRDLWTLLLQPD